MTIGARIKEARLAAGKSVAEVAAAAGLKPTTIYDLERGDSDSTTKLHLIADFLNVESRWLEKGGRKKSTHASLALLLRPKTDEEQLNEARIYNASGLLFSYDLEALAKECGADAELLKRIQRQDMSIELASELARKLEAIFNKDFGWLDKNRHTSSMFDHDSNILEIPHYSSTPSMGSGQITDHIDIIKTVSVSKTELSRLVSFTSPSNLGLLTAYGDSMEGTFNDGDVLLIDGGVTDVKLDAVYVLELDSELYVKRLQRRPNGSILMISDNKKYEPYLIEDIDRENFRVRGRVLLAWNARRL